MGQTFSWRFIFPFPSIPSIPLQRMYHECIGPSPVFVGRLRRYVHSVVESTEKMYLYCSRITVNFTSKCSYIESSSRFHRLTSIHFRPMKRSARKRKISSENRMGIQWIQRQWQQRRSREGGGSWPGLPGELTSPSFLGGRRLVAPFVGRRHIVSSGHKLSRDSPR